MDYCNGSAWNQEGESLGEFARNNIPVLRRIFVRIQGATMCAYCNIRALSQRRIRTKRQVRWGCLFLRLPYKPETRKAVLL